MHNSAARLFSGNDAILQLDVLTGASLQGKRHGRHKLWIGNDKISTSTHWKGLLHTYSILVNSAEKCYKRDILYTKVYLISKGKCILRFMKRARILGSLRRKRLENIIDKIDGNIFPGMVGLF